MNPTPNKDEVLALQRQPARNLGVPVARRHIMLCRDQTKPLGRDKAASLRVWEYLKRRLKELGL